MDQAYKQHPLPARLSRADLIAWLEERLVILCRRESLARHGSMTRARMHGRRLEAEQLLVQLRGGTREE